MHYNPTGKPEKDRTKLGIWFNKVPVTHEVLIRQAGDPLATTKGGLSIYRAEGREIEYSRRPEQHAPQPHHAEHSALRRELEAHRHHAGDRRHHALRDVAAHAPARQEPEVGDRRIPTAASRRSSNVPKFDFNWQFNYELAEPLKIPAGQQDHRHRRLRQLGAQQVEPGPAPAGLLVRAELGRDVPAVHRVLGRLAGPHGAEAGGVAAAECSRSRTDIGAGSGARRTLLHQPPSFPPFRLSGTNLSRAGIFTLGSDASSITASSGTILLSARM